MGAGGEGESQVEERGMVGEEAPFELCLTPSASPSSSPLHDCGGEYGPTTREGGRYSQAAGATLSQLAFTLMTVQLQLHPRGAPGDAGQLPVQFVHIVELGIVLRGLLSALLWGVKGGQQASAWLKSPQPPQQMPTLCPPTPTTLWSCLPCRSKPSSTVLLTMMASLS